MSLIWFCAGVGFASFFLKRISYERREEFINNFFEFNWLKF
jgi:hypothetical protein